MCSRRRISHLVDGVSGAMYTGHRYHKVANAAFLDALNHSRTRRVGHRVFDVDQEIIDLTDTELSPL